MSVLCSSDSTLTAAKTALNPLSPGAWRPRSCFTARVCVSCSQGSPHSAYVSGQMSSGAALESADCQRTGEPLASIVNVVSLF